MAHNERADQIRRLIESVRKVSVAELSDRFQASQVTIRKDLEILEREGYVLRTHGGAILAEDSHRTVPFSQKAIEQVEEKRRIAQRAVDLLGGARTVILDAGTTNLAIASLLRDRSIHVITNSLAVANELSHQASGTLILLGGDWRRESQAYIGPFTLKVLDEINADVVFLGASGFTMESGFTCQNSIESQVKARMIMRSRHAYVVCDSSKWGHVAFSTFAHPENIEALVTDENLPLESRLAIEEAGAYVLTPSDTVDARKSLTKERRRNGRKYA